MTDAGDTSESAERLPPIALDPRVTLAGLRQLVQIERLGSVGAVARELKLSQPTVSSNLSRLESALGLPLLLRTRTGTRLTAVGVAIAAGAEAVVKAADDLARVIAELPLERTAPIRIAASMTIAEQLVPLWLANVRIVGDLVPVGTTLLVGNSDEVMDWVRDGSADVGFVEGITIQPGLVHRPIAKDELVAVVGPRHPWFSRTQPISPSALVRSGLVIREHGSGTREVLVNALASAGVELPPKLTSFGSTSAILTAVRYGGAVAVVSRLTVASEIEGGKLHALNLLGLSLTRRLSAIWSDATPPRADAATLVHNIAKFSGH